MADQNRIDREAADWYLFLHEEPDDAELLERFDAWLDADPAHVEAWARISDAGAALANAPAEDWPRPAARHRRQWGTVAALAIAAAIAFVVAPGLGLRLQADYRTQAGELKRVALADGSVVQMGPGSAVAVDYAQTSRHIRLLAGEAWFEVQPNPARPFSVTSGGVSATVLGTGFEVKRGDGSTSVAVGHGRVLVRDDAHPGNGRVLTAGQWARLGPDRPAEFGQDRADMLGAWRDQHLLVRNRTIAEAIEDLRPWYPGTILLADRRLGQRRVTGFYDLRDPKVTLESLIQPDGGRVASVTPWVMIVTR